MTGTHSRARIAAYDWGFSLYDAMERHQAGLESFVSVDIAPLERARAEEQDAEAAVRRLERLQRQRAGRLDGSDGRPLLIGAAYTRVMQEYNRDAQRLGALHRERDRAAAATRAAIAAQEPRSLAVRDALAAVAALRDPYDTDYAIHWRRAIRDVHVEVTAHRAGTLAVTVTRWSGSLLLHQDGQEYPIPFAGESSYYPRGLRRDLAGTVDGLRDGRPLPAGSPWFGSRSRAILREALGVPSAGVMPLLRVADPRLLRIGMAALYPPLPAPPGAHPGIPVLAGPALTPRRLPAAARRLGEPLELVKRLVRSTGRDRHLPGAQRKWITAGDRAVAALLRDATARGELRAANYPLARWQELRHAAQRCNQRARVGAVRPAAAAWLFPRGRIELSPCPWCGTRRPVVLLIREATEPVCGRCRRDRAGIDWPARPYDRYRLRTRR